MVAEGAVGRRGMDWESGVSRCKILYIELINKKILLYNMENYNQYFVINHNGKEYENNVSICILDSFCYIAKINTSS